MTKPINSSGQFPCWTCQQFLPITSFREDPKRPGKPDGRKCLACKDAALLNWKRENVTWHAMCPDRLEKYHAKNCTREDLI